MFSNSCFEMTINRSAKVFITFLAVVFLVQFENAKAQNPSVSFSTTGSNSGCSPLNVQFVNSSTNAATYYWDFGNGNTSTVVNPTIVYLNPGNYTVKLVAYGSNGNKDSLIKNNFIAVVQTPVADFISNSTATCIDNQISFTNLSQNYDSCLWDFGDGITSNSINPSHTYTTAGQFTVTLIAYNSLYGCSNAETKTQYIIIHPKPVSNFNVNLTSTCNQTEVFSFTSNSSNANSWTWNFGDGATSNLQNPNHAYSASGIYSVSLVSTNSFGCSDTLIRANYITVLNNPNPQLSADYSAGCTPFTVHFNSTTVATSYLWNFGANGSSSIQNPYFTYISTGNFLVTLTVTYQNGCTNSTSLNTISVSEPTIGSFYSTNNTGCSPLDVRFYNTTQGSGNSYFWEFGDGTTSTQVSPSHIYSTGGTFVTYLTVTNPAGCALTVSQGGLVTVGNPDATFNSDLISGCPPLNINFSSLSAVTGVQYNWNFGDGGTSSQPYPQHTYSATGNYTVSLTATDILGCSSTYTMPNPVSVNTTQSNFTPPAPVTTCAPFNVNFSDSSAGVISWLWNFGDGSTSALQNPSHTYMSSGTYNVSLNTQANGSACDQEIPVYSTYIIHDGSANFSFTTELCPPYTAYFNDSSINAVSWLWDFGDGTTSTQQNPTHVYSNPGSYNVTLTVTTAEGCTFTAIHNYAINFSPLIASPTAFTTDTVLPLNVQFAANTQGATQWLWSFGDGGTSNLQNPLHIYNSNPPYDISLTISNDSCSITLNFPNVTLGAGGTVVLGPPIIIHSPEPQKGCAPLTLNFHNPKLNTVSWFWDFGDGSTSNLENPAHTYFNPGIYTLTLITYNQSGNADTMIHPDFVIVNGIMADFSLTHANGCIGNAINVADNSTGAVNWEWNFGDGSTGIHSTAYHLYSNNNANYVISLNVTDSAGCSDFLTQSFYGAVNNAISANKRLLCGSDTVLFSSSILNYASYVWDFGDGNTSTQANPFHVYGDTGIYSVLLTVTDTSACSQVFNLPYTIQVFNPVADFIITERKTYCTGGVYITFTNISSNSDSWLWNFGDGTTSVTKTPVHYYTLPGYYNVTLTAFKNNCSSSIAVPNAVYVTNRSADFTFVKSGDCLPITIDLTDLSVDAVSWLWDFGDGTSSTLQNPSHIFLTKPVSDVKLTIADMYGCPASKTLAAIHTTIAAAHLTNVEGCKPLQVSFPDSSENAVSWLWNFGDGTSSTVANPSHVYQNIGFYNVQLIVGSASGCNDTLTIDSLIHVAGPMASFTANLQNGCSPAVVDFTDTSLNTDTWFWNFGDSSYSTSPNPSHIYNSPGNYSVTLAVSDSVGCSDTLQSQNNINVRGPVASFNISGGNGCTPYSVQFNNTSANASDWFWSFGDGDSSAVFNPLHDFNNPGNYVVSLITHDSTGCESIFTYPDTIHVYTTPTASFSISDSLGCAPLNVMFNNTSSNGNSYSWDFGDGSTSSINSLSHNFTLPGAYYVSLITSSQGGCSDTLQYPTPINVYSVPVADFSANVTEGCAPLAITFTNGSSGTQNETYLWDFGNGYTSTLKDPVAAFFVSGIYTVSLSVSNGGLCSDIITKTAYIRVYETNPPAIANILDVTVASNTSVDITWANVADPDLYEYRLYRLNSNTGAFENIYSLIDTSSAGLNVSTTYTDNWLNTLQNTYTYKVQTVDHCGNRIDLSGLTAHTTINLTAVTQNKNVAVGWTFYEGCNVGEYRIYRADANNIFNLITTVSAGSNSWLDTTVTCPIEYAYKIKAIDLCGTPYYSFSDTSIAIPESDLGNQFVDVVFSTVVDNKNILTNWDPPQLMPDKVVQYNIYRSTDKINYDLAGSVPPGELNFTDTDVDVQHQHYYYRVKVVNECDVVTMEGIIGSSILLKSDYNEMNETVKLRWTKYEGWDTGVDKYLIEKKNTSGVWETFKIVDGNTLEAEDR